MSRMLPVVLALLVAVSFAHAQEAKPEKVDNPQYQNWARFEVGAFAQMKTSTSFGPQKTDTTIVYTLKSLTKEKAVVTMKTTMVVGGQKIDTPAQEITHVARVPKVEAPKGDQKMKKTEGKETLTVGGKKIECKWIQTVAKVGDNETTSKVWTSDAVPGMIVKMESSTQSKQMSTSSTTTLEKYKGDKK